MNYGPVDVTVLVKCGFNSGTKPCPSYDGDFDTDGDVDGKDLQELANNPSLLDLVIFAGDFGSVDYK